MLSVCPNKCLKCLFEEKKVNVYLVSEISSPAWAAGLALKEWWDGEAESWSNWCVRNSNGVCQKYYWCVSEISLTCVKNIIDVCRKYYWCVMEILMMCVWNFIDVCLKYYWQVLKYVISVGHILAKNFQTFVRQAYIDNALHF